MRSITSFVLSAILPLLPLCASAGDWPRCRGPDGTGVSGETGLAATWSDRENLLWKTSLPGPGASSPIVLGDSVFITCYSGYGVDRERPGHPEDLRHHLLCLGLADGRVLWSADFPAKLPEEPYRENVGLHGYASGTPVTDGSSIYADFGYSGVRAFGLGGERLWFADIGSARSIYGAGASPILAGNLLIVNGSASCGALVALHRKTGKEAWRMPAGDPPNWSTPLVVDVPGGPPELVYPTNRGIFRSEERRVGKEGRSRW